MINVMSRINWNRIPTLVDELRYKETFSKNESSRTSYAMLLGAIGAILLFIIALPTLIAFAIAGKTNTHRELLIMIGETWILMFMTFIVIAIPILLIVGIRRNIRKRQAIKRYTHKRNTRNR